MIYDIFYISRSNINDSDWNNFKQKYPISQKIENVKSFDDVRSRAFTKFFYVVWDGTKVLDFDFSYKVSEWDEQYIHVWKTLRNDEETYQGGIALFPKNVNLVSSREFANKFYLNKKEIDEITSRQVYPQYIISSYNEYKNIAETTAHDMFWLIWNNVVKLDSEIFNLYFDPVNGEYDHDRKENHVFKNACYDKESYLNGIVLCSKNKIFSQKEFDRKYIISKKEHEEVLSKFQYPRYTIKTYDEYLRILESTDDPLFWLVPTDINITNADIFDFYFDPNDGKYDYDRAENHVFKNGEYYDGLALLSKNKKLSEKEFNFRFLVTKKEWDIVVSEPKPFEQYTINSYEEYLDILENCKTNMFWAIWPDITLTSNLDYQIPFYDQHISHVFLNDNWYDGVVLFSKTEIVTKKEFDHRFYKNRKEVELELSKPKDYDIFFISYNEVNADDNYKKLTERFPSAKRVHGVKGIHNAHKKAAELSTTEMFWVVDADAIILEEFEFESDYFPHYDVGNRKEHLSTVCIFQSKNPINDLVYGYGGVKLLPKNMTQDINMSTVDATTSISSKIKVMNEVSNITAFNTSAFDTWRSAFRECAKLASKVIDSNYDQETDSRLGVWCTEGKDRPFGEFSIGGAIEGRSYGYDSIGDNDALVKINDYDWLKQRYDTWLKNNEQ